MLTGHGQATGQDGHAHTAARPEPNLQGSASQPAGGGGGASPLRPKPRRLLPSASHDSRPQSSWPPGSPAGSGLASVAAHWAGGLYSGGDTPAGVPRHSPAHAGGGGGHLAGPAAAAAAATAAAAAAAPAASAGAADDANDKFLRGLAALLAEGSPLNEAQKLQLAAAAQHYFAARRGHLSSVVPTGGAGALQGPSPLQQQQQLLQLVLSQLGPLRAAIGAAAAAAVGAQQPPAPAPSEGSALALLLSRAVAAQRQQQAQRHGGAAGASPAGSMQAQQAQQASPIFSSASSRASALAAALAAAAAAAHTAQQQQQQQQQCHQDQRAPAAPGPPQFSERLTPALQLQLKPLLVRRRQEMEEAFEAAVSARTRWLAPGAACACAGWVPA